MKRTWSVLNLLVMLALMLSACAQATSEAPTVAAPPPTAAPATAAVVAATAPAAAASTATVVPTQAPPVTVAPTVAPTVAAGPTAAPTAVVGEFGKCDHPVVLWSGLTGSDAGHFATLLTQFAKENPDTCVDSEGYVWDTFFQKFPTATAAGTPPDMVIFHATEVEQMASEGLMTPLDDIMYKGFVPK